MMRNISLLKSLKELKASCGVLSARCEFEDEGASFQEAAHLARLAARAGLGIVVKIGGCEAVTDMRQALAVGAGTIVAPMVETPYALSKFLKAAGRVLDGVRNKPELFINIETRVSVDNFPAMLRLPGIKALTGITIGRCDLVESMGWKKDMVNDPEIARLVVSVCGLAHASGLKCSLGGGIGDQSIDFLRCLPSGTLDYFETRKTVFAAPDEFLAECGAAILKATEFELHWLELCQAKGTGLASDLLRIRMLEKRLSRHMA